jgi:hypothetical protein
MLITYIKGGTSAQICLERGSAMEEFLEINQSETRMACGGHVC